MRGCHRRGPAAVAVFALSAPLAGGPVVINEIDSDQVGTDMQEFIELYDGGAGNTDLSGLVVVLFNGSNDLSYLAFDLDGMSTDGAGYFVIGNALVPNVDLTFANNNLQNGADAVALYMANGSDFPNNTPVTAVNLLDAIVYGTSDPDDAGLLAVLGGPQLDENANASGDSDSIGRVPDGSGAFAILDTPSPGESNGGLTVVLSAEKTGPVTAIEGAQITYTLTIANAGTGPAADVAIVDTLPANVAFVSQVSPPGVTLDDSTPPTIEWSTAAVDGASSVVIELTVELLAGSAGEVVNMLAVSTSTPGDDPGDNNASHSTTVNEPVDPPKGLVINEIRVDQTGADNDEYLELKSDDDVSVTGLTYVVIGDGDPEQGSGVLEAAVGLAGSTGGDGLFLVVEDTFTIAPLAIADMVLGGVGLNFENSDNVTHMLVANFSGAEGMDLDTDDDGTLDVVPWTHELDCIALIETPGMEDLVYCDSTIGPDDTFQPGHVYRCEPEGTWVIGPFDLAMSEDSPGLANDPCPVPPCPADTNGDGQVSVGDLTNVILSWDGDGQGKDFDADVNDDGVVNVQDLTAVITGWGACL